MEISESNSLPAHTDPVLGHKAWGSMILWHRLMSEAWWEEQLQHHRQLLTAAALRRLHVIKEYNKLSVKNCSYFNDLKTWDPFKLTQSFINMLEAS